jgi:hypothetical protein
MEWVATLPRNMVYPALLPTIRADAHTSTASGRLNRSPRRFKWTHPFRRKTKCAFCACAITFQLASTSKLHGRGDRRGVALCISQETWAAKVPETIQDGIMITKAECIGPSRQELGRLEIICY